MNMATTNNVADPTAQGPATPLSGAPANPAPYVDPNDPRFVAPQQYQPSDQPVYPPTPADPIVVDPTASPTPDQVQAADQAAAEAANAAADLNAKAATARAEAAAASQARADAADAARAQWVTVHSGTNEHTERLVTDAGYWLRSAWRHFRGTGGTPLEGSAMTFVPGEAPPLVPHDTVVLGVADVKAGVDPVNARLEDVYPVTQIATAPTVLLWLADGKVRVLKSATEPVGVTRDATPADGAAPKAP